MKEYKTEQLRNVGVISQAGAGKTSLTEAMLYNSGSSDRLGRVDDGSTVSDYDPDEIKRKATINTSICIAEWKGHKINILDTPGYEDFRGDLESALRVVDSVIVVLDATSGVEGGTEKVWERADHYQLPRIIFVNKLDKEGANFEKAIAAARDIFGANIVPVQIPIGSQDSFSGVIDVVKMKAIIYDNSSAKRFEERDIPSELTGIAEEHREKLIEACAETNDELIEKYLGGETLSDEEISEALKKGISSGLFVPVLCGSAYKNIAVELLLNTVVNCLPSPVEAKPIVGTDGNGNEVALQSSSDNPLAAFVFKTMADPYSGRLNLFRVYSGTLKADSQVFNATRLAAERIGKLSYMHGKKLTDTSQVVAGDFGSVVKLSLTGTGDTFCAPEQKILLKGIDFPKPVISLAVNPKSEGDDEKLSTMLARMSEENPTFTVRRDIETKEMIISGMGELHLNVTLDRLQRKFGVGSNTAVPKVPYKETIKAVVPQVHARYKRQSGGRGQFGDVVIKMEPLERGKRFEFADAIKGGAIPKQYIPAVEKGVVESMQVGIIAGYPVVDLKVTLFDGTYHDVDSSEMAFKIAASMAFKEAMQQAKPVLLEPIMIVEITAPDQFMGDIIGDLNSRRGRIMGVEQGAGGKQIIKAHAPLAEMFRYSIDLKSLTSGRGSYTMEFSNYEEVPAEVAEKIAAAKKE